MISFACSMMLHAVRYSTRPCRPNHHGSADYATLNLLDTFGIVPILKNSGSCSQPVRSFSQNLNSDSPRVAGKIRSRLYRNTHSKYWQTTFASYLNVHPCELGEPNAASFRASSTSERSRAFLRGRAHIAVIADMLEDGPIELSDLGERSAVCQQPESAASPGVIEQNFV
jgi:hypothetical protein